MLHAGAIDVDLGPAADDHVAEFDAAHDHEEDGHFDEQAGAWFHVTGGIEDVFAEGPAGAAATAGVAATAAGKYALTAIPQLHSLPGATASIYLDFNGHFESTWGSFKNITTPVFDTDGDKTTFSSSELAAITEVWRRVSEDFAPFRVNVTTVDPGNFANGRGLRVAIGGDSKWLGSAAGGVAYVDSFTNSIVNTVYAFSDNLGKGYAKYVAEAASHEAGHAYGLQHQSSYSGTKKTAEYNPGTSTLAPIMGSSYYTQRSTWWYGQTTSSKVYQDDMTVIARATNGFGYKADDYSNAIAGATALSRSGSQLSGAGLIGTSGDRDFFSFSTGGGAVSLTVNVAAVGANLDAKLELYTSAGSLVATANPTSTFSATITRSLAAGTYYIAVSGDGGYGSVGQYTITGAAPVAATIAQTVAPTPPKAATTPTLNTTVFVNWTPATWWGGAMRLSAAPDSVVGGVSDVASFSSVGMGTIDALSSALGAQQTVAFNLPASSSLAGASIPPATPFPGGRIDFDGAPSVESSGANAHMNSDWRSNLRLNASSIADSRGEAIGSLFDRLDPAELAIRLRRL